MRAISEIAFIKVICGHVNDDEEKLTATDVIDVKWMNEHFNFNRVHNSWPTVLSFMALWNYLN